MKNKITSIFMGNPDIALPSLEKVIEKTECIAVYTGKDKIRGRGRKVAFTPIKKTALSYSIPVEQPDTFKDKEVISKIKEYNPDIIVVLAYGFLLPRKVLEIPNIAPVNLHGSILPKYRGASPIHQSLLNLDKETGVTAQYMVKKMDAGDILHIEKLEIEENDNFKSLAEKMSKTAAVCIENTIDKLQSGSFKRTPQNEEDATYCSKINSNDGKINWSDPVEKILGEIKAYFLWPHSYTYHKDNKIIIKKAEILNKELVSEPGKIIQANKNALLIQCGDGVLSILELQLEKKKPLDYKSFLNGYHLDNNMLFD